jgi:hypothetical protein
MQDRCHRIGQTKPVTVYKLYATDSVDQDIYDVGERKSKLSRAVLQDEPTSPGGTSKKPKGAAGGGKSKSQDVEADASSSAIGAILQKALQKKLAQMGHATKPVVLASSEIKLPNGTDKMFAPTLVPVVVLDD